MAFQAGVWTQAPSNCTRSYALSFRRCAEYGTQALLQCVSWAVKTAKTCVQWAWQTTQQCISWGQTTSQSCADWATQTSQKCCDWWPCSWLCDIVMVIITVVCLLWQIVVTVVCLVWGVVVSLVCLVFAIVVTVVCLVFAIIVWIVCLVWSIIEIIFCISRANGGTMFLLTDGTVLVQECQSIFGASWATRRWWKLTPGANGEYANGTWSPIANSNVGRRYFGSAVLADGKVLVCGGEYTDASGTTTQDWNNSCEIYDPVINSWSTVPTPKDSAGNDWTQIGDPACTVLPDGTFLIGAPNSNNIANFDPAALSWTAMSGYVVSSSNEDSWVLMPDNTVVAPSCNSPPQTCIYDIATDNWTLGNNLPTSIVSSPGSEVGPGLLLYDGTGFFIGANQNTATYSAAATPQWANGVALPSQNNQNIGIMDGPGVLLVNGNVLFGAAPIDNKGGFLSPTFYFEFDGKTHNRTSDPPTSNCPTYVTRLLLLPNGDTLFCREDDSAFFLYRPNSAVPADALRPVIQNVPSPINAGSTIQVSGLQFNGLSQAVAYGDDSQAATNYPLVRITNTGTGHVRYCRTSNHTTVDAAGNTVTSMGVATGASVITTSVEIPRDLEAGDSTIEVVANGIPSKAVNVKIISDRSKGG
jgi:hypothetical protein